MSQVQTVKTMIHEMAHQKLHAIDPKDLPPEEPRLTRNAKEVEAEAVAYTVAQHYGIETSDYSFAYIAGWSHGKETPELKASLDRIRKAADEMITSIDDHIMYLQQEKGIDVKPEIGDFGRAFSRSSGERQVPLLFHPAPGRYWHVPEAYRECSCGDPQL